jgi:hypothetical protein
MQIRGAITYEALNWFDRKDRPFDENNISVEDKSNIFINPDLYSPENAEQLAAIRAHCIEHPQGVLLDAHQQVTRLELVNEPGTNKAKEVYRAGLGGELIHELVSRKSD